MFATYNDLVIRFGQEKIDEISQYSVFDAGLNDYVIVKDRALLQARAELALADAKIQLRHELTCCYGQDGVICLDTAIADGETFPIIKLYHLQLTYHILKNESSDCVDCKKCREDFKDICGCQLICNDKDAVGSAGESICLERLSCFAIEEIPSCIPSMCDICCDSVCQCCTAEAEV